VSTILLDTTQAATDTINSVATDSAGTTTTSTRAVLIEAAPSIATSSGMSVPFFELLWGFI